MVGLFILPSYKYIHNTFSISSPNVQWFRVLRHSVLVTMTSVVWALGLSLCGVLRTVLLWEHSDIALTAVVGAIASLGSTKVGTSPTHTHPNALIWCVGEGSATVCVGNAVITLV